MGRKLSRKPVGRKIYPDESKYDWLPILLDAYAISDRGIAQELPRMEKRRGRVACGRGCYACCLKESIPITEIEFAGISWYVSEVLRGTVREVVRSQLAVSGERGPCAFLVNGECAIYPVRPLACREFFVFGRRCDIDENVIETRPGDVGGSSKDLSRRVGTRLLDAFGPAKSKAEKIEAFEGGIIARLSRPMHTTRLDGLVQVMDAVAATQSNAAPGPAAAS